MHYEVHAYCLMGNHVHLLVQEKTQELARVMKRLGIRYAIWYNKRYKRVGHVFQDRYRSEVVQSKRDGSSCFLLLPCCDKVKEKRVGGKNAADGEEAE